MIHCAITTHAEDVPAAAYATVDGVCRPRCQMHIARARRDGCTVRLRPLTPEPETVTVTRAPPLALPDPEPTMSDTLQAVADAVASTPLNRNGITPNRYLPLVLRPDADAHPELCRVAECTGKVKARGACDTHLTILTKAGDTAILLPRADRSEAARKSAATRARARGEVVAPAPVVEQPAPVVPVEDGDGIVLAWTDDPVTSVGENYPTHEAAAARLGARLPDSVCSKMEPTAPVTTPILPGVGKPEHVLSATEAEKEWAGPPIPYDDDLARRILEWRGRDAVPTETVTIPAAVLARMIYATDPTPREQELQAQVEEQAGQIRRLEARIKGADATNDAMARSLSDIDGILDATASAPGQTTTERVRALASRTVPAPDQRLQAIAAELLADLEDVTDAGEPWGIHIVRALRLALDIES